MTPLLFESIYFLKVNKDFWDFNTVAEAIRLSNEDEAFTIDYYDEESSDLILSDDEEDDEGDDKKVHRHEEGNFPDDDDDDDVCSMNGPK